ncbi:MAG: hypothetical protein AAF206_08140 [Bacteroidota bacterium]
MKHLFIALFSFLMGTQLMFAQQKLHIMDNNYNSVDFILEGNKGTVLKSLSNGELTFKPGQLKEYKGEIFTIHFTNHLAYMLYHSNLYYARGSEIKDKHIIYSKINLEDIFTNEKKDVTFFLREKIRLLQDPKKKKD